MPSKHFPIACSKIYQSCRKPTFFQFLFLAVLAIELLFGRTASDISDPPKRAKEVNTKYKLQLFEINFHDPYFNKKR